MKAENTEALRTGLNEETLGFVSGGTEDGKIGPRNKHVKEALGFIKNAQVVALKMKRDSGKLIESLDNAAGSLSRTAGFSIVKALLLLQNARYIIITMPPSPIPWDDDEERKRIILAGIEKAHSILDRLV